jgi:nicotinic acid phosphoribosyltransferase
MRLFHYATDKEVKTGKTTGIYFVRTKQVLKAKRLDRIHVVAEIAPREIHKGWP